MMIDDKKPFDILKTDVLVIGAGAAGLRAAIELHHQGIKCMLISKRSYNDAHTKLAAGGINAALANVDQHDSWEIHAVDTILEGHELASPAAVETLTQEAPERVLELYHWGCPFALTEDGKINQRFFGAQTHPRTCFVGDCTGSAILETLLSKVRECNIPFHQEIFITKLRMQNGRVCGAMGFYRKNNRMLLIEAPDVIMAGGGYTGLYQRSSSRHDENTGDAVALSLEAGALLRDMEMVQFHPTGMVSPKEMQGTLVSEAVRGEGGRLFNCQGERYMQRYSPDKLELDARDIVARANYQEICEGRGTEHGGVLLDISHIDAAYIHERLPKIYEQFNRFDLDITRSAMEVAPTAHYSMGGVKVDFPSGASAVPGLYVIGEASAGLHGANRLGGNSLAETLVFGRQTAIHLTDNQSRLSDQSADYQDALEHFQDLKALWSADGKNDPTELLEQLGGILWSCAGIIRQEEGLLEGLQRLTELKARAADLKVVNNQLAYETALNLRFGLMVAQAILQSAQLRRESRGAHFRSDYPEKVSEWQQNIICRKDADELKLFTEAVGAWPRQIEMALKDQQVVQYHHLE
jgi:succinate dehydrogenase / fumarate reductase, flavoprotein subunit